MHFTKEVSNGPRNFRGKGAKKHEIKTAAFGGYFMTLITGQWGEQPWPLVSISLLDIMLVGGM